MPSLVADSRRAIPLTADAGPWTPTALGSAVAWWWEAVRDRLWMSNFPGFTGVHPDDGQQVGFISDRRDAAYPGIHPAVSFEAANDAPTYDAAGGVLANWDTDIYGSGGGATLSSNGPYTLYAWGYRNVSTPWIPFGQTASPPTNWFALIDGLAQAAVNAGRLSAVYATGGIILARWRCTTARSVKFAGTGLAEVTLGTDTAGHTYGIDGTGGHALDALDSVVNTGPAPNTFAGQIIALADTVTAGTDASIRSYIAARFPGATIP